MTAPQSRFVPIVLSLLVIAVLAAVLAWSLRRSSGNADDYPGATWQVVRPEQAGLSEGPLKELEAYVGGSGCVTRKGKMVYDWGHPHTAMDVGSAGKVFLSFFVLKAVEQGLIPSLDSPVVDFEPALATLNPEAGFKDKRITWRHLIYQTACYGQSEEPGAAFDYNDYTMHLLWRVLYTKVYHVEPTEISQKVLHPLLTVPLGFQDQVEYYPDEQNGYCRFIVSARDFCRFGYLYLHHGKWGNRQILSEEHVRLALGPALPNSLPRTQGKATKMLPGQLSVGTYGNQEEHCGSYTALWWINGVDAAGRRLWPSAPADTFGAFGYGGNRTMVVIPSAGIVASWTKSDIPPAAMSGEGKEHVDKALRLIMASVAGGGRR